MLFLVSPLALLRVANSIQRKRRDKESAFNPTHYHIYYISLEAVGTPVEQGFESLRW